MVISESLNFGAAHENLISQSICLGGSKDTPDEPGIAPITDGPHPERACNHPVLKITDPHQKSKQQGCLYMTTSLESMEDALKSFIGRHDKERSELKARMLTMEQHITAPSLQGVDTGSETKTMAPRDPQTGMPILGRQHKMVDNLPGEKRGLDAGRYFKGLLTGSWEGAPEERKSFNEASGAAGAYVLPLEIAAQFIDFARNASACVRAGATTYPMTGNSLRIPVLTQDLTASWKAELDDIDDAGGMLDKHDAAPKTLAGTALVSVELFEDAPALFNFLQGAFGRSMGQQLDFAGLRGADTYGPVGLLTNGAVHRRPPRPGKRPTMKSPLRSKPFAIAISSRTAM